jgi:hypothetical protein
MFKETLRLRWAKAKPEQPGDIDPPEGAHTYACGTVVELNAMPDAESNLSNGRGASANHPDANPYQMDSDKP